MFFWFSGASLCFFGLWCSGEVVYVCLASVRAHLFLVVMKILAGVWLLEDVFWGVAVVFVCGIIRSGFLWDWCWDVFFDQMGAADESKCSFMGTAVFSIETDR